MLKFMQSKDALDKLCTRYGRWRSQEKLGRQIATFLPSCHLAPTLAAIHTHDKKDYANNELSKERLLNISNQTIHRK